MPRKSSSIGVLKNFIIPSQHQTGLRKINIGQFSNNLLDIRNYIDTNLKQQYIEYFLTDQYELVDSFITNSITSVKNRLNQFEITYGIGSDTQYLANLADKILDIIFKCRQDHKTSKSLIDTLKLYLSIYASGTSFPVPAPIKGIVEVNVSIDQKYLKYIQMFGTPPNGIFDPVLLQQAEDALTNPPP